MTAIPQREHSTAAAVLAWHERVTDTSHRAHLGASVIGHACQRYLWLHFRWAGREAFSGRMLRLFDTGRREEARVHEELRGIGCEVYADDGTAQYRVAAHGGHFGGSMDGVLRGLPEAPKAWHVLEVKTYNDKSFAQLLAKGVRAGRPMHWAQMQVYMHLAGIDRALYFAVNKNNDEIHTERVELELVGALLLIELARQIIHAAEPPPRLSNDPAWFACKWCVFHAQCHGESAPEVNCRTCAHSTPEPDGEGRWSCAQHRHDLTYSQQRAGCASHRYIPILLERIGDKVDATPEPDGNAAVRYRAADGGEFVNGAAPGFSSAEIAAAEHKQMLGDRRVQQIKRAWPGARMVA